MKNSSVSGIKRAQKESLLYREISNLFMQAALDDPRLRNLFVNRAELSSDKGLCIVYFFSVDGEEYFKEALHTLKLYKPSLRKALSSRIKNRYTPDLVFEYDRQLEKQNKIEELIEKVIEKDKNEL